MTKEKQPKPFQCEGCGMDRYLLGIRENIFYCEECTIAWDRNKALEDIELTG